MSISLDGRSVARTVKGGTAVTGTIVFKDSAGAAYQPSVAPTMFRTRVSDSVVASVTLTYSGTPAGGYTFSDTTPSSPNQEYYLYEWKGTDASKPPVTGEMLILATPSNAV